MDKSEICAVVLAGGFGTRLSPLTDSVPKPMMRVLDKTVLQHTVEKLTELGIKNIKVSAYFKWEKICQHMKEYKQVEVVHEAVPMGTAGGAKMCIDPKAQNVLVLSGDGIFDFDLESVCEFHQNNNADVTIVSTHSQNPTRFGSIVSTKEGKVVSLLEKPPWRKVVTSVVNTGIYMLSKRAYEQIPDGLFYDFSKDLFPKLLKNGYNVMTKTLEGYWCDMGTLEEYLKCNLDACSGRIKTLPNTKNAKMSLLQVGIEAKSDVFVGDGVNIGCNVTLEKNTVLGENCFIQDGCVISASVIGKDVKIGKGCGIYGAIIGDGAVLGENCIIAEGCVLEQASKIEEGTVLDKNVLVNCEGKQCQNIPSKQQNVLFKETSLAVLMGENLVEKTQKLAYSIAKALREEMAQNPSVSPVFCVGDEEIKQAFLKGCTMGGVNVLVFDKAQEYHAKFIDICAPADMTVCITEFSDGISFKLMCGRTADINDSMERKISKYFFSDFKGIEEQEQSQYSVISGIDDIYRLSLVKTVRRMLSDTCITNCISFNVNESKGAECLRQALEGFVYNSENSTAEKLLIRYGDKGYEIKTRDFTIDSCHILALVFDNADSIGLKRAYVDEDSPDILNYVAKKNDIKTEYVEDRYTGYYLDDMFELLVSRDENFTVAALLCVAALSGKQLKGLVEKLPEFEIYTDLFIGFEDRAASMERLCKLYGIGERKGNGVTVRLSGGNVTVIPDRVRGIKMISEATNMEAAKEMCNRIAKSILPKNEKNKNDVIN